MSLIPASVYIPYATYQNLLEHLKVHAPTDAWADSLLYKLQQEARLRYSENELSEFELKNKD